MEQQPFHVETLAPPLQTVLMLEPADSVLTVLANIDAPLMIQIHLRQLLAETLAQIQLIAPMPAHADFALMEHANTDAQLIKLKTLISSALPVVMLAQIQLIAPTPAHADFALMELANTDALLKKQLLRKQQHAEMPALNLLIVPTQVLADFVSTVHANTDAQIIQTHSRML